MPNGSVEGPVVNDKTKLYIAIGLGVLVLILLVITAIVYTSGGDPAVPAAGAAAAAAAAAAATRRNQAREQVAEAKSEGVKTAESVKTAVVEANEKMAAVEVEVKAATRDEKEKDGEKLFGD